MRQCFVTCVRHSEAKNKHIPLTIAAYNGRSAVIEALLKRGANVNAQYVRVLLLFQNLQMRVLSCVLNAPHSVLRSLPEYCFKPAMPVLVLVLVLQDV